MSTLFASIIKYGLGEITIQPFRCKIVGIGIYINLDKL